MKNILLLALLLLVNFAFGQVIPPDSTTIVPEPFPDSYGLLIPDISKAIYPNDNRTYNQYVGETIAGYNLADGWRKDTVNGGFNKKIYTNPYLDYNNKIDVYCTGDCVFRRYKSGKLLTGNFEEKVFVGGALSEIIFKGKCVKGLLQGKAGFYKENGEVLSEGNFRDGKFVKLE